MIQRNDLNTIHLLLKSKLHKQRSLEQQLALLKKEKQDGLNTVAQLDCQLEQNRNERQSLQSDHYTKLKQIKFTIQLVNHFESQLKVFDQKFSDIKGIQDDCLINLDQIEDKISDVQQKIKALQIKQEKYGILLV